MIKKAVRGFKYDEFTFEFVNNEKPYTYASNYPLQRDFIVEIVQFAMDEAKITSE